MSDYMLDIIYRTEAKTGYDFDYLYDSFIQLVMDEGCTVLDFVWLACEGML